MPLSTDAAYQAALDYLLDRIDYERTPSIPYHRREFRLDRMRRLLELLGNPHHRLRVVHVAGTKGKGSTSAMIAAILSAAGYRTGLYTSPHLDRIEERVAIDGTPCTAEEFVELVDTLRPAVAAVEEEFSAAGDAEPVQRSTNQQLRSKPYAVGIGPTYFEITTAMAMLHFARQQVDAAVLEVGLGGRLDSTNVVTPQVSVITSISFDHMKQLGNTLEVIAREKAGIIKPGVPVVSGVMGDEPRAAIDEVRKAQGCRLVQLGRDFEFVYRPPRSLDATATRGEIDFSMRPTATTSNGWAEPGGAAPTPHPSSLTPALSNLELALLGRHQAANAAVALATIVELQRQGWDVPESAIRRGLVEARCPARVEVVSRQPTVVIDTAHNRASIASLIETIEESFSPGPRLLVFATTQDKQVRDMLELLLPRFDRVILTRYTSNPRGFPLEELAALAAEIGGPLCETAPDPAAAWRRAQQITRPEQLVCVTGSFFLAAEIRRLLSAPGTHAGHGN